MQDRPDLSYDLPRYTIEYLVNDTWKLSKWKMTELYAAKQYDTYVWRIVPESEEYYSAEGMPIIGPGVVPKHPGRKM
jgi:hypothetical protein